MKKIIVTGTAIAVFLAASIVPAYADNSEEVAIGILGGVIGGVILGEILERPHRHERVRVYEYVEPGYDPYCRQVIAQVFEPGYGYVYRQVQICE
jgi:hypothetical protein